MPTAVLGSILASVIGGGISAGAAAATGGGGPRKLSKERRATLGNFAERLAARNQKFDDENAGGLLLRPGGQPIKFGVQKPKLTIHQDKKKPSFDKNFTFR